MRITYRRTTNKDYWTKRWSDIPADEPMKNDNVYPLKYAKKTISSKDSKILEAGCGAGRILRYYKNNGYNIIGIDFIETAVNKLKAVDSELQIETGDITQLRYDNEAFDYVLAFGLFHNLEHSLDKAILESYRVLKKGGKICASFRADNIQTRFTDWLAEYKDQQKGIKTKATSFHKMNLTRSEFIHLFEKNNIKVEFIDYVENMPFLYKFSIFRSQAHKEFNENIARKEGYQLSLIGKLIQKQLMRFFPTQFCNIFVIIGQKK